MQEDQTEKDKKLVLRSAAYPNITIEEAIEFVAQIKKSFPNTFFTREDVVAILQRTTINRDISSSVHYGLLEKQIGEGYKLSKRVNIILNYIDEEERDKTIIECFYTPKLYIDLIEKYKEHVLPPDQQLKTILSRFHNITEAAAPQAVEIFVQNAYYSKLLTQERILLAELPNQKNGASETTSDDILGDETKIKKDISDANEEESNIKLPAIVNKPRNQLLLEQMNNSKEIQMQLSEKKVAYLIYPDNFNERDIQILKLQIDALALTL